MDIKGAHWSFLVVGTILIAASVVASNLEDSDEAPDPVVPWSIHEGDRLLYEETIETPDEEHTFHTSVQVGEQTTLVGSRGRTHQGFAVDLARRSGNQTVSAEECRAPEERPTGAIRAISVGSEGVQPIGRRALEANDHTVAPNPTWIQAGPPSWTTDPPELAQERTPCLDRSSLGGEAFTVGDVARTRLLASRSLSGLVNEGALTEPARPISFRGLPGLAFPFSASVEIPHANATGSINASVKGQAVLAESVPAPARINVSILLEEGPGTETSWSRSLVGYEPGNGSVVPALSAEEWEAGEEEPPTAELDRKGPPDVPGAIPYPLEDAVEAVTADPSAGAGMFLRKHPDAYLSEAVYERDFVAGPASDLDLPGETRSVSDGGWRLTFSSGNRHCIVETVRISDTDGLGDPLASRSTINTHETFLDEDQTRKPSAPPVGTLPESVIETDAAQGALLAGGLDPSDLHRAEYRVHPGSGDDGALVTFRASDLADPQGEDVAGREVVVDAQTGALLSAWGSHEDRPRDPPEPSTDGFGQASTTPSDGISWEVGWTDALALALLVPLYRFVLAPLYTRLGKDEILENEVRAKLYERIDDRPGVHRAALVRAAGVGEGATSHHLRKLVENELVERTRVGGYVRYYPLDISDPDRQEEIGVLRSGSNREVYELYSENPSLSFRDLARRLDLSVSTVHRAVSQLRDVGLIEDDSD